MLALKGAVKLARETKQMSKSAVRKYEVIIYRSTNLGFSAKKVGVVSSLA